LIDIYQNLYVLLESNKTMITTYLPPLGELHYNCLWPGLTANMATQHSLKRQNIDNKSPIQLLTG